MSFNHFDGDGQAIMVDVSDKSKTMRTAVVTARVVMQKETLQAIYTGDSRKGDVLGVARLAGIAASKKTSDLIPLSHPLSIHHAAIDFECDKDAGEIKVRATVRAYERTGVEMEAMVSASLAALTIYDMCKGVDKGIRIEDVALEFKEGGKSGTFHRHDGAKKPASVSFCGWSGSGKTTLVEQVIGLLSARDIRVGAIKHDGHCFEIDKPGKDSWRMTQAGAVVTAISDSRHRAVISQHDCAPSIQQMIDRDFTDVDLVIVEGWKDKAPNRIEVHRSELGKEPLCLGGEGGDYVAVATNLKLDTEITQLDINSPLAVSDFIFEHFLVDE